MTRQSIMAPRFAALVTVCSTLSVFACGDDTASGGSGGGSTTADTTASSNVSSSATKAASSTSPGITVTAQSSSSGNAGAPDGAACTADAECAGGLCLTEADFGYPGGTCSQDCANVDCDNPDSLCIQFSQTTSLCLRACDPTMEGSCGMPTTLNCLQVSATDGACLGGCSEDGQCSGGRSCDEPVGSLCVEQEDCGNMTNDNINNNIDCEDGTCLADATCVSAIADQCAAAIVLAEGTTMGNTTTGEANLVGACTGFGGAHEIVYTFTPAATGDYTIRLSSATDMGFYLRTTCTDITTEIGCADVNFPGNGGAPEVGIVPMTMGTTYTIVVDGYASPAEDGAFTLDINPRGCNDFVCDAIPADAPGGVSECTSCATDCVDNPTCGFCIVNATCEAQESCTCNDCDADAFCTDPANCTDDGFCEQYIEGCQCADCAAVPNCTD